MVSSSVPLMDQATLDAMKALLSTLKNLTVTKVRRLKRYRGRKLDGPCCSTPMVRWHVSHPPGILNHYLVAAAVILMYDIFLTFGEEVNSLLVKSLHL